MLPQVAVPAGVVTVMLPVAPRHTVALMLPGVVTVNASAGVPPKATAVALVKLAPVMSTTVPGPPTVGVNDVMSGTVRKVKILLLLPVPPGVVTVIGPVAPPATVAVIEVVLTMVKSVAAVPPIATAVVPSKLAPVMVTTVPVPPMVGVHEVMIGAGMNVKKVLLVAVPTGVVMVIDPVAPLPTVALSEVSLATVNDAAAVPPKATAVAPVKLVPVMLTTVPAPPMVGENEVMVGIGGI